MLSIKDNDKYEEIIKYSKFISFIFRVYSKNEVNDYIDKIKKSILMLLIIVMDMLLIMILSLRMMENLLGRQELLFLIRLLGII